ncbi:MAG: ABC transporter substrate-binding protein, partial [Candidatus Protistobacter heckmanni]|nr:ABC transporter substrate-binding protein [Candidatus Protistobacter heckmanni]
AKAADPLRIGIIASYSGPYADYGRKVEIIKRDTSGPAPDMAKRFAQELVVNEKACFISGLDFSPNAYAPVATQAKVPVIIMNASSSSAITNSSPFIARLSFTVQQVSAPMAQWMLKNGVKEAFTVVANYGADVDSETAFKKAFTAGGGKIVGELRTPLANPDFAAFVQKIKDVKPKSVFFFPSGGMPLAFLKAWKERGLSEAGIVLYATGDVALGLVTAHGGGAAVTETGMAVIRLYRDIEASAEKATRGLVGELESMVVAPGKG